MSDMFDEDPYLDFVEAEAQKLGKIFYIDSGEGREYIDSKTGWDIMDLSGWLISPEDKDVFQPLYDTKQAYGGKFYYVFVEWSMSEDEGLKIVFKHYGYYDVSE